MGSIQASKQQGTLLITAIEEKARRLAGHTVFRYHSLTWSQWFCAINKVAHWLDQQLGKSMEGTTVAYLGPNDIRYAVLLPALMKTGRKTLVPDGKVTNEEDDKNGPPKTLNEDARRIVLPSVEWCLDAQNHEMYPYDKTWDEIKHDEIIIHTSDTTRLPTGVAAYIVFPAFYDTSLVLPPAKYTAYTPPVFKKLLKLNVADGTLSPPHTIIQLYNDPEMQPLLKLLPFVTYIGAAMDQAIGDDLVQHTRLSAVIGSTKCGPQCHILPIDKRLWHTYEPPEGQNLWQAPFWNPIFKGMDRVETIELYAPVKDIDGRTRWVFSARKDDLTKLNWLAKFHATDIEKRMQQHSDMLSVFVGGEGQPSPYVIIEPQSGVLDGKPADAFLDELWESVITQTTKKDIEEIGIPKETVFIARPTKPFKRTAKHTLMRKAIEEE
ncbi:hypothetical protein K458DRAFT_440924 [Lentithecium fluviatile CBS 122367]|uniref:Acetyl-CoA synthetase-like protein n=1 Tax=Lentithecium fluviatile CBS 122367 TaxID=1168545 RepID=A0A6G1J8X8_9PLEO|nr:hypothetical protein K458DRAFT_440924 [Lentithecium fluviatile CBS 122367]